MDITNLLKRFLLLIQATAVFLVAVMCLARPAIRVREPEIESSPGKVIYKTGERARLFCSVQHLGERTVVWRRVPDTNPLTIGATTWIEDPRIYVEHSDSSGQWDLIIDGVTSRDMGEYECQISISKKMLRHVVELYVTENVGAQVKRNPEIQISGTQFVSRGGNISLFCNISMTGNPRQSLQWFKGSLEISQDGDRVFLLQTDSLSRNLLMSNLRVLNAESDDSGLYSCKTRDAKLMTSAQVIVLTGGSNNVKRAGSSYITQESGADVRFHNVISHSTLVLLIIFIHHVFT